MSVNSNMIQKLLTAGLITPVLALALTASAAAGAPEFPTAQATTSRPPVDLVTSIHSLLDLTDAQKQQVDPLVHAHQEEVDKIRADKSLTRDQRHAKLREVEAVILREIKPFLTSDQFQHLGDVLKLKSTGKPTIRPQVTVSYEIYQPTDSSAKSIFGNSPSSLGFGLRGIDEAIGRRSALQFSVDSVKLQGSSNQLWVVSPQLAYEYRQPIAAQVGAYGKLSGGPAYMDYTFDKPTGEHFAAKKLGLDAGLEVGLRYDRFRLAIDYRVLSHQDGVNFNGIQYSLTWLAWRF